MTSGDPRRALACLLATAAAVVASLVVPIG